MSPPPMSGQAQRGEEIKPLVAQKFDVVGRMSRFYLTIDMDDIAQKTITTDLRYLEKIHTEFGRSQKRLPSEARLLFIKLANKIEGQVHQIIPHLYAARNAKKKRRCRFFTRRYRTRVSTGRTFWICCGGS